MNDSNAESHVRRVSHRQVWQLAWPLILSNLSTPLLGLVDTAILGHLPEATHLAAVALGASLITFVFWSFGFLRMGTTSLTAQALGADNEQGGRQVFWRSVQVALGLSLLLWLLQGWLLPFIIGFMSQPGEVQELALVYSHIRVLAAPMVLVNYVIIGWCVGRHNTRWALILTVLLNLTNIVLDVVLVYYFKMGSAGAAWASLGAEAVAALAGLLVVFRTLGLPSRPKLGPLRGQDYRQLLAVNGHLFVRTATLLLVLLFFTAQGAKLGETTLAANAILLQLIAIISYGLDGFAHAAEALVGRAAGTRHRATFIRACRLTSIWALASALVLTLALVLVGPRIISLFSDIESVVTAAKNYYWWIPLFPLVSMAAYQLDGIFIGWGRTDVMQFTMLASAFGVFFPIWLLVAGNTGLWCALLAFNGSRGILLFAFLRYKFKSHRLF